MYNPVEFDIGLYSKKIIKEELGIEIPTDEVAFIASHFINAQETKIDKMSRQKMLEIVDAILSLMEKDLQIKFRQDSIVFNRLMLHLQAFAQRILKPESVNIMNEFNDDIYFDLSMKYLNESKVVEKICVFIHTEYKLYVSQSEKLYLLIHLKKNLDEIGGIR